ncbi:DUF5916 domain-containing protein [Longimicrobium terrae]|uniref:Hydrolase n=1 Tax=Longimicrobium terrae TaxID=1639882 RepID=A0A841GZC3_9BACT|nr:DUF5916 domain-containing protein [Longimicrobium terrae]MBB4636898.1 hypothetical protein [Longimicrobium terrae]MBB6071103.1 hypothetical protein [Longimicrobium terrae]NNC29152.1 carbohydrate binding family 9 domain-containing protein [Longimicrobium terrae]
MLAALLLIGATVLAPADTTRKTIAAHRLAPGESVAVDGRLNDAVWAAVPVAGDFVQQNPDWGQPASQRTEARIAYDDHAVYVAVRAWDTRPDSIASLLARRDASGVYTDWVQIIFDSYNDKRSGYRFGVNPRGVKKDVFHFNDGNEDLSWDAVWDAEVSVDAEGWSAEFRIPLSQLRFRASEMGQTWGLNILRDLARRQERSYWSPMSPDAPGYTSRFGTLTGLTGLRAPRRLEVLPYTVASVTRAPAAGHDGDPFFRGTDPFASVGADVKYGLSSDLTLTATINPDFGQVEADPSEVNLSAFESYFSDKRPFFVEGVDIFQFGVGLGDDNSEGLFYSRRIGRAPQRRMGTSEGRPYVDSPQQTTILGAAKLTGKVARDWNIGVLNAITGQERTRFFDAQTGDIRSIASEPLTSYGMARVRRDFHDGRSAVGAVLTATNRALDDDGLLFLPSSAYTGGLDFRSRFAGGDWEVAGWALGSLVKGDTLAIQRLQLAPQRYYQREDAGHLRYDATRESLNGRGAGLQVGRIGGSRYRGGVLGLYRSPGFEINELGYQRSADQVELAGYGRWFQNTPQGGFRSWNLGWNAYSGWTTGRERTGTGGNVNGNFQLSNLWSGYGGAEIGLGGLETRELRGGPALVDDGFWSTWFGLSSDTRRRVSFGLDGGYGGNAGSNGRNASFSPYVDVRPSSRMQLSLSPGVSWSRDGLQYVTVLGEGDDSEYLFARLDQTTVSITTRLSYTFTPDLSLQFYAQPFVSAGDYRDFMTVADPRASRFEDRYQPADEPFSPDFNFKQMRTNAVVRWEYRPGSTLFVVWSQGRENFGDNGDFRFGRDFNRLFGFDNDVPVPATNVLMLKLNYWLNL